MNTVIPNVHKITATSRRMPCPVCGDESGDCRITSSALVLCHSHQEDENIPGWGYRGLSKNGVWGQWAIDDGSAIPTPTKKVAKLSHVPRIDALPLSVRDRQYRQIARHSGLSRSDREKLRRRGLNESQIDQLVEAGMVYTWQTDTTFPGITAALPGTDTEGNLRYLGGTLAIAVPLLTGEIVGAQIKSDGKGYRWASSASINGHGPHLADGTLPIGVYQFSDGPDLNIAEGFLKPCIAAICYGGSWLGAASGHFTSSSTQLAAILEHRSGRIILNPDGGMLSNSDIIRKYKQLNDAVEATGQHLYIRWWDQTHKTDGDIDEISSDVFHAAQLITWAEFWTMVDKSTKRKLEDKRPLAVVQRLDTKTTVITKKEQERDEYWTNFCKRIGIAPIGSTDDKKAAVAAELRRLSTLPQNHQIGYFGPLPLVSYDQRRLYVLDGQKATRKTSGGLSSLIKQYPSGLVAVPTRVLARAAATDLGIGCYLDDIESQWMTICPESLHKVAYRSFECVILDEANEGIQRGQDGTLGTNPKGVRKALDRLLPTAKVVAISTDETYRPTVAAAQRMGGFSPDEVEIIQRKRPSSEMTINLYLDSSESSGDGMRWDGIQNNRTQANDAYYTWFSGIVEKLRASQRVLIPCGSQTKAREIDRMLRLIFTGRKRGQCLDGKYTPAKVKKAFAQNPNGWAQELDLDWLIYTPVFNSGVSIETYYWDCQYEYISVFETATAASQRGERYRPLLNGQVTERHVYMTNRGLPAMPDLEVFFPDYWKAIMIKESTLSGGARSLGKALGVTKYLDTHQATTMAELDQRRELPEYWAIQAQETYFKREMLTAEWESNGWLVVVAPMADSNVIDHYRQCNQEVKEDMTAQKARTQAKAKAVKGKEEDGPVAAAKNRKFQLQEKCGEAFNQLQNPAWIASWDVAPGTTGINQMRTQGLLKLSETDPKAWNEIQYIDALREVALLHELPNLPMTPATSKEIEMTRILSNCPVLLDIIQGRIQQWTKKTPGISEAAAYLRDNAPRLAALTQHNQRIHGLQFNKRTCDTACVHKALKIVGAIAVPDGRETKKYRYWKYTLAQISETDTKAAISQLGLNDLRSDDQRHKFRLATQNELLEQLDTHIQAGLRSVSQPWSRIAQNLLNQECLGFQIDNYSYSENLDGTKNISLVGLFQAAKTKADLLDIYRNSTREERSAALSVLRSGGIDTNELINQIAIAS